MIEIDENFTTVAKTSERRSYGLFQNENAPEQIAWVERMTISVDFDLSVNLVDENIRCVEGNGAGEDGEG